MGTIFVKSSKLLVGARNNYPHHAIDEGVLVSASCQDIVIASCLLKSLQISITQVSFSTLLQTLKEHLG